MVTSKKVIKHATKIWNYMLLNHKLKRADYIVGLGSSDIGVAKRSAQVYLSEFAPWLIFSGGKGAFTKGWNMPEAKRFAQIAIQLGVPKNRILLETKSTNTGENIRFTYELIKKQGKLSKCLIIVTKPYMERRVFATFKKQWPLKQTEIIVTSTAMSFDEYVEYSGFDVDYVVNMLVGDLQRIMLYPKMGFQISQEVPDSVLKAYKKLIELGYTERLINNTN